MLKTNNKRWNSILFISIIVVLHIFIKTLYLSEPSIWYDEAFSIYHSQFTINHIIDVSLNDQNPPIYNIILLYWIKFFGNSAIAVRMLSVLFSVLSVPILFYLAKKYINANAAVIVSILYLSWNELLYYSMEARCYTLVGFLVLFSTMIFLEIITSNKKNNYYVVLLSFVNVLLLLSHYLSFFYLVTQFVFFIIYYSKDKNKILPYVLSIIISIIVFFPWLQKISKVLSHTSGGTYWLKPATYVDIDYLIKDYFNNYITFCFILIIIIVGTITLAKQKQINRIYIFFLLCSFLPAIISYFLSNVIPVFLGRYILYSLFGFIFLIAYILSNTSINKYIRYFSFAVLLILLISEVKLNPVKNQNFKSAVQFIKEQEDDKTIIIISPRSVALPFTYYYDSLLFKNLDYFEWELLKNDVLLVENKEELNRVNLSMYKKIINIKSFGNYFDTEGAIIDSLSSTFKNVKNNYSFSDAAVRIYENENYEQQLKQLFPNTNINRLSFYCPFNIVYTDSISYYKIQKGIKWNAEINYSINTTLKNYNNLYVSFNYLRNSIDNSLQMKVMYKDNIQNVLKDTIINLDYLNKINSWENIELNIPFKNYNTDLIKITFINNFENTEMLLKDINLIVN